MSVVFSDEELDYSWEECPMKEEIEVLEMDCHTAANLGALQVMDDLLTRCPGVSLGEKNSMSWTPLMYAGYQGHNQIVELLLTHGVDPNEKNDYGCSALMLACLNDQGGAMELLANAGADVDAVDQNGWTSLLHATTRGREESVKILLEHGANPNYTEPHQKLSGVMIAAIKGYASIFRRLVEKGGDYTRLYQPPGSTLPLIFVKGYANRPRLTLKCNRFSRHTAHSTPKPVRMKTKHSRLNSARMSSPYEAGLHKAMPRKSPRRVKSRMGKVGGPNCLLTPRGPQNCRNSRTGSKSVLQNYTVDQFRSLFVRYNVEKYMAQLKDEDIDLMVFLNMTDRDFQGLGIKFGPTKKLQMVRKEILRIMSGFPAES